MEVKHTESDEFDVEVCKDDWKTPPAQEIIRRNFKRSNRKRICRQKKPQLENCDFVRDESRFSEPHEEENYSFKDSSVRYDAERTSPFPPVGLTASTGSENKYCRNTVSRYTSTQPDLTAAIESYHFELQSNSPLTEYIPSRSRVSSGPVTKHRSVSFISDPPMTIPSYLEQRPTTSKIHQNKMTFLETLSERSQSCHSSVDNSSTSSIEREQIMVIEQDKEEFSVKSPTQILMKNIDDDSDEYDTDCEPETTSDFRDLDLKDKQMQQDSDIGHITYQKACRAKGLLPRSLVCRQLMEKKLNLKNAGLLTAEVKAVCMALPYNHRVEEIDMSNNSMSDRAVTCIMNTLLENTYVNTLNISESTIETTASIACSTLLSNNIYLTSLDISGCSIGDSQVGYIAQAIQVNSVLQHLNLSRNRIGLLGVLQLGRALGENASLTSVDLSWNHIRGAGAVALEKQKLEDLDVSWNGLGYEGGIAFSETVRVNKSLKRLNLENNRINWDGAHYLAKGLAVNNTLEVFMIGSNPISMQGCEEILKAVSKPTSPLKLLSFKDIPINTKIALKASEIARCREFNLQHGGVFNAKDKTGIQRPHREDPFSLLIRYLSIMGIRVMDLFRMFDKNSDLYVTKEMFIQGLKRVRVPLDDKELLVVAKQLRSNKRGEISYQELANTVQNRIVKNREEYKQKKTLQVKKRDEKLRVLHLDKPLQDTSNISDLRNIYGSKRSGRASETSRMIDTFSRRDSSFTHLPPIRTEKTINLVGMPNTEKASHKLISQKTEVYHPNSVSFTKHSVSIVEPGREYDQGSNMEGHRLGSSYANEMRRQQISSNLTRRQRFL